VKKAEKPLHECTIKALKAQIRRKDQLLKKKQQKQKRQRHRMFSEDSSMSSDEADYDDSDDSRNEAYGPPHQPFDFQTSFRHPHLTGLRNFGSDDYYDFSDY